MRAVPARVGSWRLDGNSESGPWIAALERFESAGGAGGIPGAGGLRHCCQPATHSATGQSRSRSPTSMSPAVSTPGCRPDSVSTRPAAGTSDGSRIRLPSQNRCAWAAWPCA
ncbi:hypothetical protein G6F22_020918 [Rhizopus arrhizus]|nr:hypothetical protein G6F22_020918 [Rhizopus arrhizus]